MMIVDNKYNIGDIVFLKTDNDQAERLVTAIQVNPNGLIYRLVKDTTETWHYDFEISREKNFVLKNDDSQNSA